MDVRPITAGEKIYMSKIQTLAFLGSHAFDNAPETYEKGWEVGRGAFVGDKLVAGMDAHRFTVNFDGHEVGMQGIGGVATLPEARNKGCIRALFQLVLNEARNNGMVFSYLYPFSHLFYRKFGYEVGCRMLKIKHDTASLTGQPRCGSIEMWQPGEDTAPFKAVYQQAYQGSNLSLVRSEVQWNNRFDINPYKDRKYAYLYRDDQGIPAAYAVLEIGSGEEGKTANIYQQAYTSLPALKGMLGHFKSLDAQITKLVWHNAPESMLPAFPEPWTLSVEVGFKGMNRIINAPLALSLMRAPAGNGSLTLSVMDDFLPENQGIWSVCWQDGAIAVEPGSGEPDATLDIRLLSQLVTGYHGFADGVAQDFKAESYPALCALFPRKLVGIHDYF